ncbi:hypothetical protein K435DRAFT_800399 [Dendrothele bispora CBS 962.96]|uniref:Uncharacterized protein n=1 Tax=Dendrothele bispora (strain CBS 962.96) TaxID=1314807 RepID=A0A4S8LSV7_DENBC|nr:hypothetical protein K435DRAFT_800399 [Dendrothele bispora CBS 962.96]
MVWREEDILVIVVSRGEDVVMVVAGGSGGTIVIVSVVVTVVPSSIIIVIVVERVVVDVVPESGKRKRSVSVRRCRAGIISKGRDEEDMDTVDEVMVDVEGEVTVVVVEVIINTGEAGLISREVVV